MRLSTSSVWRQARPLSTFTQPIAQSTRLLSTAAPSSTTSDKTIKSSSTSSTVDNSEEFDLQHLYPAKGTYTSSSTRATFGTGRPIPLNVRLNEFAPLRHPKTHNDLVAEIQFRAFETRDLDFFVDFALRAAYYLKMPVSGSIPLPTRRERWTVIRSPFVQAKSKENFERRTHKRAIRVFDTNPDVVEIWLATLQKHAMHGVGMKANMYTHQDINVLQALDSQSLEKLSQEELEAEKDHLQSISKFNPNNVSFGNSVNAEVAQEVLNLLSDPVFKPLLDESKKDSSPGAPEHAIKQE